MKVCTNCGYEGKPIRQNSGALAVLMFTLLCTTAWSFASQLFWITLPFAAISTILFMYWFFTTKCPECKNVAMVGKHSISGRKYAKNPRTATSNVVYSTRSPEPDIYSHD